MKISSIAIKIIGVLFISVWLIFGLKSCVVSVWQSASEVDSYGVIGSDNRSLRVIFLPHNEAIIWHSDPDSNFSEGTLTKMRGTYGTHYVWRLWKVKGPNVAFGYRIYPPDTKPVMMEITILERFMQGRGDTTFPPIGHRSHQIILFSPNAIRFQNMWLQKESVDPEVVSLLLRELKTERSVGPH